MHLTFDIDLEEINTRIQRRNTYKLTTFTAKNTLVNSLFHRQYCVDHYYPVHQNERLAWQLLFDTGYARQPNRDVSRRMKILDTINQRFPPLSWEEVNRIP